MVGSIRDVYYVLDKEWRFVQFNKATEAFFRQSAEELRGRTLWEVFPLGALSPFTPLLLAAMNENRPGSLRGPSIVQVGRIFDLCVVPIPGEGIGVSVVDLTDRARAEERLVESQKRLDLAVGAHNIGIFDWNVLTGQIHWSRELEAIFGLAPGAFEGTAEGFRDRVLPEDLDAATAQTDAALAAGQDLISFNFRIRRSDGEIRWVEGMARVVYDDDGAPLRIVGTNIDVTERKTAERHQRLLINELNHRVKNTLAIVQAIAWQSFRAGGMSKPHREAFEGRIAALSAAHDVLTDRNWESGSIDEIVTGAVAPHETESGRLTMCGPPVALEPKTAVALALAVHELATNAVKHGALSVPGGRIDVRWTVEDQRLRLIWREAGGPPVEPPTHRGFGARLLERGLSEELQGCVQLEFPPEGVVCTMEAKLGA